MGPAHLRYRRPDPARPRRQQDAPAFQPALDGAPELPEALRPTLARLRALSGEERDALARRVLIGLLGDSADLAAAPIVMAALQVVFADRASRLQESDIPYTDPATVCPVCGTAPVASVLRIGGREAGLRYLHCGCCGTEWHMVRSWFG